jgi:hypothetical protein
MTVSSLTLNGRKFLVLFIHDVSMTEEAQKKHGISVKTWRVETHIPTLQDSIFTPDVVMAAFFSGDILNMVHCMYASVCLLEKKIGAIKLLEAYSYDEYGYSEGAKFTLTLNGFLGCTSFLNLGLYLLKTIAGVETRSMYTIYVVDKNYLDADTDNNTSCDTCLETFLRQKE